MALIDTQLWNADGRELWMLKNGNFSFRSGSNITIITFAEATKLAKAILKGLATVTTENAHVMSELPEALDEFDKALKETQETSNRFKTILEEKK